MVKKNSTRNDPDRQRELRQLRRNQKLLDWEARQPGYSTGESEESKQARKANWRAFHEATIREYQRQQEEKERKERNEHERLELLRRIDSKLATPSTVQFPPALKSGLKTAIGTILVKNPKAHSDYIADCFDEEGRPLPLEEYRVEIKANPEITSWSRLYRDCPRFRRNLQSTVSKVRKLVAK